VVFLFGGGWGGGFFFFCVIFGGGVIKKYFGLVVLFGRRGKYTSSADIPLRSEAIKARSLYQEPVSRIYTKTCTAAKKGDLEARMGESLEIPNSKDKHSSFTLGRKEKGARIR